MPKYTKICQNINKYTPTPIELSEEEVRADIEMFAKEQSSAKGREGERGRERERERERARERERERARARARERMRTEPG